MCYYYQQLQVYYVYGGTTYFLRSPKFCYGRYFLAAKCRGTFCRLYHMKLQLKFCLQNYCDNTYPVMKSGNTISFCMWWAHLWLRRNETHCNASKKIRRSIRNKEDACLNLCLNRLLFFFYFGNIMTGINKLLAVLVRCHICMCEHAYPSDIVYL